MTEAEFYPVDQRIRLDSVLSSTPGVDPRPAWEEAERQRWVVKSGAYEKDGKRMVTLDGHEYQVWPIPTWARWESWRLNRWGLNVMDYLTKEEYYEATTLWKQLYAGEQAKRENEKKGAKK